MMSKEYTRRGILSGMTIVRNTDAFIAWIEGELKERGWSLREFGRRGGMTSAAISNVLSGYRKPGYRLCRGIARALEMNPEDVFRRAGLLPPAPDLDDPQLKAALFLFEKLTVADQERVLAIMKALACVAKGEEEEEER